MDMDPAERGGVEWVSEFCPVKGSTQDPWHRRQESYHYARPLPGTVTRCLRQRTGGRPRLCECVAQLSGVVCSVRMSHQQVVLGVTGCVGERAAGAGLLLLAEPADRAGLVTGDW